MATSLEKLENEVQIHHLLAFIRLQKSVRRYLTKCGCVVHDVHKYKPRQFGSYWTEFLEIFTR